METRYADVGDAQVAYQVIGEGPRDIVALFSFISHVDVRWEHPSLANFTRRLSSIGRTIVFDRRGVGASDPLPAEMTWEEWADDVTAIMDSEGVERAALIGLGDAGPMAILFAATFPQRVSALILGATTACSTSKPDYPWGIAADLTDVWLSAFETSWGREDGPVAQLLAPSLADDRAFRAWYAKLQRAAMTPRTATRMFRTTLSMDARPFLPLVQAPTLVYGRRTAFLPFENAEYLAREIPKAELFEAPGSDLLTYVGDSEVILSAIERFLTGADAPAPADRILATVLFTDIVGSTDTAVKLGDSRWRDLLDVHDHLASTIVRSHSGRMIKTTGDGILATFDGPAKGIRCAHDLRRRLEGCGLRIRCGLHAGEVELRGDDVGGIGVNLAARVMSAAGDGEILASSTVRDLVLGSSIAFEDRGKHTLKGIPGEWALHLVTSA